MIPLRKTHGFQASVADEIDPDASAMAPMFSKASHVFARAAHIGFTLAHTKGHKKRKLHTLHHDGNLVTSSKSVQKASKNMGYQHVSTPLFWNGSLKKNDNGSTWINRLTIKISADHRQSPSLAMARFGSTTGIKMMNQETHRISIV
jgi:hypothetical protein